MAALKQIQCVQVAFTSTSGAVPVQLSGVQRIILQSSADCYVDFDQPVAITQSFKLFAANANPTTVELDKGLIQNLYVQGAGGSGTLYLIIIAG